MHTTTKLLAAALLIATCNPALAGFVFTTECTDGDWGAYEDVIVTPLCPHDFPPDQDDSTIFITTDSGRDFTFHSFKSFDQFQVRSSKGGFLWTNKDVIWDGDTPIRPVYDLGPLWQNIQWASVLLPNEPWSYSHHQATLIDLYLAENTCEDPNAPGCPKTIDEPPTWALLMLPVLALAFRWRFKQQFWRALKP